MKKGILLAAAAVLGATGCESMKKGCKTCGTGYGANSPATVATTATAPGTTVVNGPAGAKVALPDYAGRTIGGPAGSSVTVPNYTMPQLGAKPADTTVR